MLARPFTPEQQMFRSSYRKFLEKEIAPHMEEWREQGIVDRQAFKRAGDHGFLMVWPDEKYGGIGDTDMRYEQIIIEENAYALTHDFFCTLHSRLVGTYFTKFGSEAQREKFLPPCVRGDWILAIAMTEPDTGSDLKSMRTTAIDNGDHFVLNGSKTYISNGINADVVIVAAKTDPVNNPSQLGLFIVERGMAGFERGRNLKKLGMKAQDTAELFFNDVVIPRENVLGDASQGFQYLSQGLAEERLLNACESVANAQKAFDVTVDFVKERRLFGQSLADFQNTQFKLAEQRTQLDLVQCYVDQCVAAFNAGQFSATDAAKAKLAASEMFCALVDACLQLHGGAGYMDEYPICRLYADARITRIYAGSSEVMKLIISRDFLRRELIPFNERDFDVDHGGQ